MMEEIENSAPITLRSFTVELQTYIEQDNTAELHTVTVRNVVEFSFKCEVCLEAFTVFDHLKKHWKLGDCSIVEVGIVDTPKETSPLKPDVLLENHSELEEVDDLEESYNTELTCTPKTTETDPGNVKNTFYLQVTSAVNDEEILNPAPLYLNVDGSLTEQEQQPGSTTENMQITQWIADSDKTEHTTDVSSQDLTQPACDNKKNDINKLNGEIGNGKIFRCTLCEESFTEGNLLKLHVKSHESKQLHKCGLCEKSFVQKGSLTFHLRKHAGEKPFHCSVCKKGFLSSSDLNRHARRHEKIKPYECSECNKRFADKSYLTLHMKLHSADNPHICTICNKSCTTKSQLVLHLRTHTGDKPFECTQCDKKFSNLASLKYHLTTHDEKKFTCEICDAKFCSKSGLQIHNRKHTGEKPYSCEICHKSFAQNALKIHMRYHSGEKPFPCSVCSKSFTTKTHLKTHMQTHSEEKLFSCSHCDKTFRHKCSLNYHVRSHLGERPFPCPVCEKCFIDSSSRKRHAVKCAIKNLGRAARSDDNNTPENSTPEQIVKV